MSRFPCVAGRSSVFAGLVGSGRTEVARTVSGLYRKPRAMSSSPGTKLDIRSYKDAIRQGIVYLTEDRAKEGLFLDMGVSKNISVIEPGRAWPRFKLIQRRKEQGLAQKVRRAKCRSRWPVMTQKLRSLSGGNQQKVLVSKLLTVSPKVVLMDEPTRGIDIGAKSRSTTSCGAWPRRASGSS